LEKIKGKEEKGSMNSGKHIDMKTTSEGGPGSLVRSPKEKGPAIRREERLMRFQKTSPNTTLGPPGARGTIERDQGRT